MKRITAALALLALFTTGSMDAQVRASIPAPTTTTTTAPASSQLTQYDLTGTVTESGSYGTRALAGAVVRVMPTDRTTTTDANGRFAIDDLTPGTYVVSATANTHRTASKRIVVNGDETVTLNLKSIAVRATSTVNGVIRDADGNAVQGATIRLIPGRYMATSAADGSFSIADVPDGKYTMIVKAPGQRAYSQRVVVGSGNAVTVVMRRDRTNRVDHDHDSDKDSDHKKQKKAKKEKKEKTEKKNKKGKRGH